MTGGAAILTAAIGVGAIFAGYVWVAHIGESFCESTELMIDYVNGDEKAGEMLELKAAVHVISDVTIARLGMKASSLFAKTHLDQKVGSFFAKAFERTSIGCDGALEILNRISPKYTNILKDLINCSGNGAADFLSSDYETGGVKEVEETLEVFENSSGKLTYNGDGTWTSSEGLIYGQSVKDGNRVLHVLEHTKPNLNKRTHTVFNVEKKEVIGLIDEAWKNRGTGVLQGRGTVLYEIKMGRIIGTNGEDTIIIVTDGFSNEIVTSYPKAK